MRGEERKALSVGDFVPQALREAMFFPLAFSAAGTGNRSGLVLVRRSKGKYMSLLYSDRITPVWGGRS